MKARGLKLGVFLALTGAFLVAGSRERPWGDARIMYEVAESLAARGSIAIRSEWPPMSHKGPDGRVYSQYALGPSLVALPGVALRSGIDAVAPEAGPLTLAVTSHLAQAALGALACLLFFGLCRRLGVSAVGASVATLVLAFATGILVYARSPFSEILQATCFTGFAAALLAAADEPTRRRAIVLGLWAGALLNAKAIFALSLAGGAGFLLVTLRRDRAALGRVAGWGLAGFAPLLGLALWYNAARWGNPIDTGYGDTLALMGERTLAGLWGLLLSPGKSVFLYSPPLILAVLALPAFCRRAPRAGWILLCTAVPPLLFYSRFLSWAGDYCWGPRYLIYLLPLALLPLALWIDRLLAAGARLAPRIAVGSVILVGLCVQVLGSAFYWDHYIRIAMKARQEWLGSPDRAGAAIAEAGRGHCDSCFEDMHGHQWLPPLSPIEGHLWLLRHVPAGRSWDQAKGDAPWRRYTTLELDAVEPFYDAARVDWWGLLWLREHPGLRGHGLVWLFSFLLIIGAGAGLWLRGLRGLRETGGG